MPSDLSRWVTRRSGFPYPLIDRVTELEAGRRAQARKLVSMNEPYFVGHFPGLPVMPGVLLCESLAQLASLVVEDEAGTPPQVAEVRRARFRRPVIPGDVLALEVERLEGGPPWRFRGRIRVGDVGVAEAEFVLVLPAGAWLHPLAQVDPRAELGDGVRVEAYAVIGRHVRIGRDTWIGHHAHVTGRTTLGAGNRVSPFASVGGPPQDLKYRGEPSTLTIGDENRIREFVSINPGTESGGMETVIGDRCLFMVNSHVAHDCRLADDIVLANAVALAGHVVVARHAIVGGLAGIHQFVRLGESSLCAAGSMVSLDVPPYCTAAGDRARLFGLNLVGLKRRGFSDASIRALKRAYRTLFQSDGAWRAALERTRDTLGDVAEVRHLLDFVEASERGVCRP